MRLLVLGGTAWLGHTVAALAVARGHEVTCLARGSSPVAEGARLVTADRCTPEAYAEVPGDWDAVLDVARHPDQVRGAVAALAGRAAYLAFVSTVSVYADDTTPGQDESGPLHPPLLGQPQGGADYGPGKVACEQAVTAGFAGRSLVARAGLIGGPGDHTGRTGYWPVRFAGPATADGAVVAPDSAVGTQVIDVRDLAGWLVDCCQRQSVGVVNAVGDPVPLGEHLAVAREVAGHRGALLPASQQWLQAQGVQPWMGPRSMPLWLPLPDHAGLGTRDPAAGRALGLHPRPLAHTLADTLTWERRQGPQRTRWAGLTDAAARDLVAAWRRDHGDRPRTSRSGATTR